MATLGFIEKRKISRLLNDSGYVLDFTNATWAQFVFEKTGEDLYSKYGKQSKGKNLEAIMVNENDIIAGKFLIELLHYMQTIGRVTDNNRALFSECALLGNRLLGRKVTPANQNQSTPPSIKVTFDFDRYLRDLQALSNSTYTAQSRGYAFEKYLYDLFKASGLDPHGAFRIEGEQIDGSFVLRNEIYLLEAKWQTPMIEKSDLVVFNNKVSSKSGFTRGLFISYSGYSEQAINTLPNGTTVKIILMTVQELAIALERKILLPNVLWSKVRAFTETGDFNKFVL